MLPLRAQEKQPSLGELYQPWRESGQETGVQVPWDHCLHFVSHKCLDSWAHGCFYFCYTPPSTFQFLCEHLVPGACLSPVPDPLPSNEKLQCEWLQATFFQENCWPIHIKSTLESGLSNGQLVIPCSILSFSLIESGGNGLLSTSPCLHWLPALVKPHPNVYNPGHSLRCEHHCWGLKWESMTSSGWPSSPPKRPVWHLVCSCYDPPMCLQQSSRGSMRTVRVDPINTGCKYLYN